MYSYSLGSTGGGQFFSSSVGAGSRASHAAKQGDSGTGSIKVAVLLVKTCDINGKYGVLTSGSLRSPESRFLTRPILRSARPILVRYSALCFSLLAHAGVKNSSISCLASCHSRAAIVLAAVLSLQERSRGGVIVGAKLVGTFFNNGRMRTTGAAAEVLQRLYAPGKKRDGYKKKKSVLSIHLEHSGDRTTNRYVLGLLRDSLLVKDRDTAPLSTVYMLSSTLRDSPEEEKRSPPPRRTNKRWKHCLRIYTYTRAVMAEHHGTPSSSCIRTYLLAFFHGSRAAFAAARACFSSSLLSPRRFDRRRSNTAFSFAALTFACVFSHPP